MKAILCSLLLCSTPLSCEDVGNSSNTLSSELASYNGNTLELEGSVEVHHALGTLSAEKVFLEKSGAPVDVPFALITLKEHVDITLQHQEKLLCDEADLDFISSTGRLTSKMGNLVNYNDFFKENPINSPSLQISSQSIDFSFLKQESIYLLNVLKARSQVEIIYNNSFVLRSDEASYRKEDNQCVLSAYPITEDKECVLLYEEAPTRAKRIDIDISGKTLELQQPRGVLPSRLFAQENQTTLVSFSCDTLSWDHTTNLLHLNSNILIEEEHFGSLSAKNTVSFQLEKIDDKMVVRFMHLEGESSLSHEKELLHCLGSLHMDGSKGQITALSPRNKEGKVPFTAQIVYMSPDYVLQSDQAFLEYLEPTYALSFLILKGQVSIQTRDGNQYGLADKLSYTPETATIILSANRGNSVLFLDAEQKALMSAKEVHITRNPKTKQMEAKGVGNVSLSLSSEEKARLQQVFPHITISEEVYK